MCGGRFILRFCCEPGNHWLSSQELCDQVNYFELEGSCCCFFSCHTSSILSLTDLVKLIFVFALKSFE